MQQQQEIYGESTLYFLLCTDKGQRWEETGEEELLEQDGFMVVSFDAEDASDMGDFTFLYWMLYCCGATSGLFNLQKELYSGGETDRYHEGRRSADRGTE